VPEQLEVEMKVFTKRGLIRALPEKWAGRYGVRLDLPLADGSLPRDILKQINALDLEHATEKDIELIIGNSSWTNLICDECKQSVEAVVQVGAEPDYESNTANLCRSCCAVAFGLIREA
jgi:hypothetical protein